MKVKGNVEVKVKKRNESNMAADWPPVDSEEWSTWIESRVNMIFNTVFMILKVKVKPLCGSM